MIVAGEPSTYDLNEWDLIEQNHCLIIKGTEKAQLEKLESSAEWNVIRDYLPHRIFRNLAKDDDLETRAISGRKIWSKNQESNLSSLVPPVKSSSTPLLTACQVPACSLCLV